MNNRQWEDWLLYGGGGLLSLYLIYAQAISAVSYDLGVSMGTQEPSTQITEIGAAFWYGFAFADLLVYIPLLTCGLLGHARRWRWSTETLSAALGITLYWPVVCLAAITDARGAPGWHLPGESEYWVVLPLIAAWAAWGLWFVCRDVRPS